MFTIQILASSDGCAPKGEFGNSYSQARKDEPVTLVQERRLLICASVNAGLTAKCVVNRFASRGRRLVRLVHRELQLD